MKALNLLILCGTALGVGATTAVSCVPEVPTVSFRCNPRGPSPQCPDDQFCCSDDPSSASSGLPDYRPGGTPTPIFASNNNGLSARGMCVRLSDLDPGTGLPLNNCPVPCDPTWNDEQVDAVCGSQRKCCQTVQLEAKDCVSDGGSSVEPANGLDAWNNIANNPACEDDPRNCWRPSDFATHQDPNFEACLRLSEDLEMSLEDCIGKLGVADTRGFCMSAAVTCYQEIVGDGVAQCEALVFGGA